MKTIRLSDINLVNKVLISSFIFVGLLASLMILNPSKAHATLNLNPDPGTKIPSWVRDYSRNCDSGTQSPSFDDWISATGSLTQTSVDVDYGTTSIGLVYAMASVVCLPNSAVTENNQLFTGASPGVNNIVGKQYRIDYTNAGGPGGYKTPGTYRGAIVGFDYAPTGGFTSSGLYTVTLYSVAINDFDSGAFLCIGARKAGMGNPTNARDYDKCEPEPTDFSMWVNVKGGPPGGQTFVTCPGGFRGLAYDGDDLNASLAVAIILDKGKTSERIISLTANEDIPTPEFNLTALGAFGVSGKKGFTEAIPPEFKDGFAHTYQVIAGNIPTGQLPEISPIGEGAFVCPNSASLTATGNVSFDDDEEPTKIYFSGIGAKTTSSKTVNGVKITREYVIRRQGAASDSAFLPAANPASDTQNINSVGWTFDNDEYDAASYALKLGDQVCVNVVVSPGSAEIDSSGNIKVSGADLPYRSCRSVVNKPYVSFFSNDLAAGYGFDDADDGECLMDDGSQPDSTAYPGQVLAYNKADKSTGEYKGSAAQLAIKALGQINGVNSGSTNSPATPGILSFANTPATTPPEFGGKFGSKVQCIRNYLSEFDSDSAQFKGGPFTIGNALATVGNDKLTFKGDLIIDRSDPVPEGARWTIYVDGNVIIRNNIRYAGGDTGWTDRSKIPALYLIVRGNISIADNVERIDGIYIAQPKEGTNGALNPPTVTSVTGRIFTCTNRNGIRYALGDLFSRCNKQLTINGSFIAQRVHLDRTAKSLRDGGTGESAYDSQAAERFISSPEVYLAEPNLLPDVEDETKADYFTTLPPIL